MLKLIFMLAGLVPALLSAQVVEFDFPSCRYLDYYFVAKYGNRVDTIAKGRIDDFGKASFTLPSKYASYRGVGKLFVPYCDKDINLIINGEQKIMLTEHPNDTSKVHVSGSNEDDYLKAQLARQGEILSEYTSLMNGQTNNRPLIFALPEDRITALEKEYGLWYKTLDRSPLYAARIVKLMNYLSGFGSSLNLPPEEANEEIRQYITNELDFKDLYTSGFWQPTLEGWQMLASADDSLLLAQTRQALDRTDDIPIRKELLQWLIRRFSMYGKDNLLVELGSKYLTIPINGMPAPELATESEPLKPGKSLILFYDPQCGNCHNELHKLTEKYPLLSDSHNRMQIISVSADTDKDNFESVSQKFPWADKICDFKGIDGENFNNYGIVGTPTYILVDEDGIIRGRYAQLSEFLKD